MTKSGRRFGTAAAVLLLLPLVAGALGGCQVKVSVAPELSGESIEVNLVGVPRQEYEKWSDYSMTQYQKPDDPLRGEAVYGDAGEALVPEDFTKRGYAYLMKFEPGKAATKTLAFDDPIWDRWDQMNARYLFIIACLGPGEDKPGWRDFRREAIRIQPWPIFSTTVQVRVSRTGVSLVNVSDRKLPDE